MDLFTLAVENRAALLGGAFGTGATLVVQYLTYRYNTFKAELRFHSEIIDLTRHLDASLKSLEIDPDRPRFFIAARLRFCKFMDGRHVLNDLSWLTHRKTSQKILPMMLAMRNSDIFLEEIASRVDGMTLPEISAALEEARTNLKLLSDVVRPLNGHTKL